MADGRGCGRFGKNAFVLLHAPGGAGQLVAQPAPFGPAGGAVLRRWPAIGRVSQKQERQEVPARYGVWQRPLAGLTPEDIDFDAAGGVGTFSVNKSMQRVQKESLSQVGDSCVLKAFEDKREGSK